MIRYSVKIKDISARYGIPCRIVRKLGLHLLECSDLAMQILANDFHRQTRANRKLRTMPKSMGVLGMRSKVPGMYRAQAS